MGVLPFVVPGSAELMAANVEGLRTHQIVLWSKTRGHGPLRLLRHPAVDRIEYAETGAAYEYMDLVAGGRAERLTDDEPARVAAEFSVDSPWV